VQAVFGTRSRDEWLDLFRDIPACVGPVNDLGEALKDPQVTHRGMVAEVGGEPVGPGSPLKMSGAARSAAFRPAPGLGEHTAAVLATVGVGEAEVAELRARGVL